MSTCFSNEEIVLINNLLYIDRLGGPEGTFVSENNQHKTIGDFAEGVISAFSRIDDEYEYSTGVTGAEYKQIIGAVKRNAHLCGLIVMEVHIEAAADGGGKSVFLYDPAANEALVVFKGTESNAEWVDNVSGLCRVPTEFQENALKWFRSLDLESYDTITVTGHSKGGNKSKYITIMDDRVTNCFSFDGQGFSDEFIKKYAEEIRRNESKITNIIAESDFVNILLNDVGQKKFYLGTNYGRLGFAENHCANAILFFDEEGDCSIWEARKGQDERMKDVDVMLNSFIRSQSMSSREGVAGMLGNVIVHAMSSDTEGIIGVLSDEQFSDAAAELLAFILRYKEEKPKMVESVRTILYENGFSTGILGIMNFVTNHEIILEFIGESPDTIIEMLQLNEAPKSVIKLLTSHIELFGFMVKVAKKMRKINPIGYRGEDITPNDTEGLQGAVINRPAKKRLAILIAVAVVIVIAVVICIVKFR